MKIKLLAKVYNRAKQEAEFKYKYKYCSLLFFIKCACDIGCSKDTRSIYDIIINSHLETESWNSNKKVAFLKQIFGNLMRRLTRCSLVCEGIWAKFVRS